MWAEHINWRFWLAVLFSAVIHCAIVLVLTPHISPHRAKAHPLGHTFTVMLSPIEQTKDTPNQTNTQVLESAQLTATEPTSEPAKTSQPMRPKIAANVNEEVRQPSADKPLHDYYGSHDIERRALPLGSIELEQLGKDVHLDGMPIRLRIYVDAEGKVKKIEQLAVLSQDQLIAKKIEQLLMAMPFVAAKKAGKDVNSYQDVEFSFQPNLSMPTLPSPALTNPTQPNPAQANPTNTTP